jgi:hypothetical protein
VTERTVTDKDVPAAVHDAVAAGQKITAIRLLRETTAIGFANAKVLVDRLAMRHARNHAHRTAISGMSATPGTLALAVLAAAAVVAWRCVGAS